MTEAVFILLGYLICSIINSSKPDLKNPDRILKWDPDVFAWRPMPEGSLLDKDEVILFAYEMKKNERQ